MAKLDYGPSSIVETFGSAAWEEIGALTEGVFCGVLEFFSEIISFVVATAETRKINWGKRYQLTGPQQECQASYS